MKVSSKLMQAPTGVKFIVEGNPDVGYTLYRCQLTPVGHFKRSWQAVHEAMGEGRQVSDLSLFDADDYGKSRKSTLTAQTPPQTIRDGGRRD